MIAAARLMLAAAGFIAAVATAAGGADAGELALATTSPLEGQPPPYGPIASAPFDEGLCAGTVTVPPLANGESFYSGCSPRLDYSCGVASAPRVSRLRHTNRHPFRANSRLYATLSGNMAESFVRIYISGGASCDPTCVCDAAPSPTRARLTPPPPPLPATRAAPPLLGRLAPLRPRKR